MTNEELDRARVDEAYRQAKECPGQGQNFPLIVARLAREGWTPPVPVDPDMVEAELIAREVYASDKPSFCDAARMGIKRGRALAAAEAKPGMVWQKHDGKELWPVRSNQFVCVKYHSGGFVADRVANICWPNVTHYCEITPPAEDK